MNENIKESNETMESLHAVTESAQQLVAESTSSFITWIKSFLTWENFFKVIGAFIVLLFLWIVYRLIKRALRKAHTEKMSAQRFMLMSKMVNYAYFVVVVMYILSLFGIKLSAVWGAAGIAGVAIGFAAQTSVSNLISGIFVLSEGIMQVGDFVTVGDISGTVDSVDLLSVKVHTTDNHLVRIPNSSVINTNLTNISFFPQRRLTINVFIDYKTDMDKALETILKVPALCPTVLHEPAPVAWFDKFGESGISLNLAVWFNRTDFFETRNSVYVGIKKVFDDAGISIPFTKVDVKITQ
ncbi:MAG: mechanosensitive ion channel family protein [Treponema sp.]|nr:mechanosensitive ion channel family protein [Treponema sp.]